MDWAVTSNTDPKDGRAEDCKEETTVGQRIHPIVTESSFRSLRKILSANLL